MTIKIKRIRSGQQWASVAKDLGRSLTLQQDFDGSKTYSRHILGEIKDIADKYRHIGAKCLKITLL